MNCSPGNPGFGVKNRRGNFLAAAAIFVVIAFLSLGFWGYFHDSSGAVGSAGGPHTATGAAFAGDYSVFWAHDATHAEYQTLLEQIASIAGSDLINTPVLDGVSVIVLKRATPPAVSTHVLSVLRTSPAVDHVEMGGCNRRMTACEQWTSRAPLG